LNCIVAGSTLTSAPDSWANAANGLPAVGSWLRSTGSVSLLAASHAAAPTFFCTAASWAFSSAVGASAAGTAADADGAGSADGPPLGAGAASGPPPPWPPVDGVAAGAPLPVTAGASPDGAAPLGAALGAADGGFTAVAATSPVALSTLRNRICAA
jgi:hypothetical protein